jgi:hypothetical protein
MRATREVTIRQIVKLDLFLSPSSTGASDWAGELQSTTRSVEP